MNVSDVSLPSEERIRSILEFHVGRRIFPPRWNVDTSEAVPPNFRRISQACALATATVGITTLLGWMARLPALRGVRASYIPMAPNTAFAFIIMGAGLWGIGSRKPLGRGFAVIGAVLVGLISALRMAEYLAGVVINQD